MTDDLEVPAIAMPIYQLKALYLLGLHGQIRDTNNPANITLIKECDHWRKHWDIKDTVYSILQMQELFKEKAK